MSVKVQPVANAVQLLGMPYSGPLHSGRLKETFVLVDKKAGPVAPISFGRGRTALHCDPDLGVSFGFSFSEKKSSLKGEDCQGPR